MARAKLLRCAIYTRKSSEEGLDQAFNSLDAQRQAGLDYIRSQKHEGWTPIDEAFDDGAYSGGNMERPALQRLLALIRQGRVDVVVVYKVDRLSRSLGDFAEMMKVFDEHKVSFVSVTQQFNTTTSMGRLTLNMLLSFAQFEREVTGERIRDKIAATKKKGLWVGGQPPLGYRLEDRQLLVVPEDAQRVVAIFRGYLETGGSLLKLAAKLNAAGVTTKRWTSSRGVKHGGKRLTPGYLHKLLTNPLYRGKIVHKDQVWAGKHDAIIDQDLWDEVHATMSSHRRERRQRWEHPHLLKGKLFTCEGEAMSPTSSHPRKKRDKAAADKPRSKRIVRYYVSQKALREGYDSCPIKSINAEHLDEHVRSLVLDHAQARSVTDGGVRECLCRVTLAPDELTVELDPDRLQGMANDESGDSEQGDRDAIYRPNVERHDGCVRLTLPISIQGLDGKRFVLTPDGHDLIQPVDPEPQPHIATAIGRAYRWRQVLRSEPGLTLKALAKKLDISDSQVRKYLPLINLSPRILRLALDGSLPRRVSLQRLVDAGRELDWGRQAAYLNLRDAG